MRADLDGLVRRLREVARERGADPEDRETLRELLDAAGPPGPVPPVAVLALGAALAPLFRHDRRLAGDTDAGDAGTVPAAETWL